MALVHQATCPTCGQVHTRIGMRSVYAGPAVEVCGECVEREAHAHVEEAKENAIRAARDRFPENWELADRVRRIAEFDVLLRLVCKGRTEVETLRNIASYWDEVRKEVES